jgi:excisionase family DNA binding protein
MTHAFEDLQTIKEAAEQLGRHPRTLMRWAATSVLPVVRVGRTPFVHTPSVRVWLESRVAQSNPRRRR